MSRLPIAPARRPAYVRPARLKARPPRRGLAFSHHRDPRRFGSARAWLVEAPAGAPPESGNLRLFAHSFGAAFLFVSVLIA